VTGWREYLNYIAGRLKALVSQDFLVHLDRYILIPYVHAEAWTEAFHCLVSVKCTTMYQ
jgi:hypothetical protein